MYSSSTTAWSPDRLLEQQRVRQKIEVRVSAPQPPHSLFQVVSTALTLATPSQATPQSSFGLGQASQQSAFPLWEYETAHATRPPQPGATRSMQAQGAAGLPFCRALTIIACFPCTQPTCSPPRAARCLCGAWASAELPVRSRAVHGAAGTPTWKRRAAPAWPHQAWRHACSASTPRRSWNSSQMQTRASACMAVAACAPL